MYEGRRLPNPDEEVVDQGLAFDVETLLGRRRHIHFEVYPDLAAATRGSGRLATSQIALPEDICGEVYATDGYAQSVTNLQQVSLATDMVFGDDGGVHELGTVTGRVAGGLMVDLPVPVRTA
jgi:protocatechuate 3,4-dioxygenase beta subunit